ncbi:MAG: hypothetical protein MUC48_13765 [Leptolyngbya sp. Prado105]|jgi:hypothetical protein|nr:hypothetical protein [Leptolyngbya sp. Prado105]
MSISTMMQSKFTRSLVASTVIGTLMALAAPVKAGVLDDIFIRPGVDEADFGACARDLTRGKVSAEVAADACAKAIRPKDLGICVDRITRNEVAAADALSVCRQVRRPVEASTCVVDIRRRAPQTALVNVLSGCRQSLLPARFSNCVVDLSRDLKLTTEQSIANCISASDISQDLQPSVLPGSPATSPVTLPAPTTPSTGQPSAPLPGGSTPVPPATTPGTVTPQRF